MNHRKPGDPLLESKNTLMATKEMKYQIRDLQKTLQRELEGLYLRVIGIEARMTRLVEKEVEKIRETEVK